MNKKIILMFVMVFLLVGTMTFASAVRVDYSNQDMTAHIKDTILWGLINIGEQGTMELKSHKSVIEVLEVGVSWNVNMYYDLSFSKAHQDALGTPTFTNLKTGKEVNREWKYVYWGDKEYESPVLNCLDKYCINLGTEIKTKKVWLDYNSKEIPKGQIRIGIMVNNKQGDYIDGVWEIQGKKIKKHAGWTADLNNLLENFWTFNEASGNILDNVSTYDLTNTNGGYANGTKDGFDTWGTDGVTAYADNTGMPNITGWGGLTLAGWLKPDSTLYGASYDWYAGFGEDVGNSQLYLLSTQSGELIFRSGDGTSTYQVIDSSFTDDIWHFICATTDIGGDVILNVDGVSVGTNLSQSTWGSQNADLNFGADKSNNEKGKAEYSNWGLWSRAITQGECAELYNGGVISTFQDVFGTPPTSVLNSPIDNAEVFNPLVIFNGTGTDNSAVQNMSLIVNNSYVITNSSPINATLTGFSYTLTAIGLWNWTVETCDDENSCTNATSRLITYSNDLSISLGDPINTTNSTSNTIAFTGTSKDDTEVKNISFILNDLYNETNNSVINNTLTTFNKILADDNYTWNMETCDDYLCLNSTARSLIIDTLAPNFTVYTPIIPQVTFSLPYNVSLNVTTTDNNLNECWYYTSDNSTNITYTCNTLTNVSFSSGGNKIIYDYANDILGSENNTEINFLLNYLIQNATYESSVLEAENTTFYMNLTASNITNFNGTLYWNGTSYSSTASDNGTYGTLTTEITAPLVTASDNINFYWTYYLNGNIYNSTVYNQTVVLITPLNITSLSCVDKALRFDLQDEANLTAIYGDVEYNFKYGITNNSLKEIYGSLTNVTTFYACINATASNNYTIGYGELQYRSNNYVDRRYYLFEGQVISNNTLTNHTLRDLETTEQTSFLMTFEDTSLNKYTKKYTALWRWYPNLNEYQIVEMGKTDEQGETVSHVNTEDTDYRVGVYEKGGSLIKLGDPLRFICASAPCTFTLRVGAGDLDYSTFFDVETSLTYNETTNLFTLIYNDPNQLTSEMRLLVTRETGSSTLVICDDTSSGFTGVMTCNTSIYTGLKKAVVYRSASPEKPIAQLLISVQNTTFQSGFGLFISIFLWLAIVLTGLGNNPLWTIILSVVALLPALFLGSINIAIFTGIAVLGAIVIHFIKRALT